MWKPARFFYVRSIRKVGNAVCLQLRTQRTSEVHTSQSALRIALLVCWKEPLPSGPICNTWPRRKNPCVLQQIAARCHTLQHYNRMQHTATPFTYSKPRMILKKRATCLCCHSLSIHTPFYRDNDTRLSACPHTVAHMYVRDTISKFFEVACSSEWSLRNTNEVFGTLSRVLPSCYLTVCLLLLFTWAHVCYIWITYMYTYTLVQICLFTL